MGQLRPIFAYFRSFQTQICTKTSVGFELGLLEGEHADHLNTTTFHYLKYVAHGALPWLSGFFIAAIICIYNHLEAFIMGCQVSQEEIHNYI